MEIPEPLHVITKRHMRWPVSTGQPDGSKSPGDSVAIHAIPIVVNNNEQIAKKPSTLPPHPTIAQTLTSLPLSLQFAFSQVTSPTPYGNVIDSYRVYRNTSANNFSGATLVRTFKHDPTHQGPITVQDNTGGGKTYYYFITSVDTTAQESSSVGAQAGAVTSQNANPSVLQNTAASGASLPASATTLVSISMTTKGNAILLTFSTTLNFSTGGAGNAANFQLLRDATPIFGPYTISGATNDITPSSFSWIDTPPAGAHTYQLQWFKGGAAVATLQSQAQLQAVEFG